MKAELTENLELVLKIFGIIGGAYAAYVVARKEFKKQREKTDKFFLRNWSNQGLSKKPPPHYLHFVLWPRGEKIEGHFNFRNSEDEDSWELLAVRAKRHLGKLKCRLGKIEDGEFVQWGVGQLKKTGETSHWKAMDNKSSKLPSEGHLWSSLPNVV